MMRRKHWLWWGMAAMILLVPSRGGCAPLMVEKNLFAQDRKPPSGEQTAATPQSNKPGLSPKAVQLDGVFIYGDTKKALVRVKGQPSGARGNKGGIPYMTVQEGDKVGDFQVIKIEPKAIILEKDGQQTPVGLFAEGKVIPPPPPVPQSPALASPGPGQGGPEELRGPGRTAPRPPNPAALQGQQGGNVPEAHDPGAVQPHLREEAPEARQQREMPEEAVGPEDEEFIEGEEIPEDEEAL